MSLFERVRACVLAFLAGLWNVDQCDSCRRPITGEPYASSDGRELCTACAWAAEVAPEQIW